jgi:MoaA/NifB/PqqE/SkfB family radical SAM enzyme
VAPGPRRWLEIALDYRCNLRCIGCHACHDTGERLTGDAALGWMREGRAQGIERVWFGGGEPTLREDLLRLVHAARQLGFVEIAVQTNGLRLAYAPYSDALVAAGITEVRVNVKSHRADVHDRLSGADGCHAMLLDAIAGMSERHVRMVADVLLTRTTAAELPDLVGFFAARGIPRFVLWLLSAADAPGDGQVEVEVPRIGDLGSALAGARAQADRSGVAIVSLHTPPCTLPADLRSMFAPAASLSLVVVGPDGRPFPLEHSAFEGGAYLDGCARCVERPRCGGPRADYLRIHGASEFAPIAGIQNMVGAS